MTTTEKLDAQDEIVRALSIMVSYKDEGLSNMTEEQIAYITKQCEMIVKKYGYLELWHM